MTNAERLIAQLYAGREAWVELEPAAGETPALEVLVRRPAEEELGPFIAMNKGKPQLRVSNAAAKACVVNWRGFTEATLLGASVGSSEVVDFDKVLWDVVVADKVHWAKKAAQAVVDQTTAFLASQAELQKN